jgi:hypothetical protein
LNDHRESYDAALEERREAHERLKVSIRYSDQSVQLKEVRAYDLDQARWSFSSQQVTLRRLDKAWPKDGDGCRWDSQPEHPMATCVRLRGIGHVRVHQHRRVRGRVKTISVKRKGDRWYVVLSCNDVPACEALPITNMTKRAAPRPDGKGSHLPNGGSAKSGLNKSIVDAGWRVFLGILAHRAESAGRELIPVNPANTSRTCARCAHCAKENRPTQAKFACMACGHTAHADVNAAINIVRAGLALREAAEAA